MGKRGFDLGFDFGRLSPHNVDGWVQFLADNDAMLVRRTDPVTPTKTKPSVIIRRRNQTSGKIY